MIKIQKNQKYLLFFLFILYFLSRFISYELFQIKADPKVLLPGWHVLELNFLNTDMFNSILHLHSQPPLWNIIIGISGKIVDGKIFETAVILNLYNYILSLGIIFFSYKTLKILKFKSQFIFLIILLFVVFNPNIIFYENIINYNHSLTFLFTNLVWLILKFFGTKQKKFEFFIYLNICIQSLIWAGVHPIILVFFYITISIQKKSFLNYGTIFFAIMFLVSISPMIKNKIIFNKFSNSTWIGINLASTMNNIDEKMCLYQIKYPDHYSVYQNKYNREVNHPVARASSGFGHRNSVSQILLSDLCLSLFIEQLKKTPFEYIKGRAVATVISHSKFSFEYLYLSPENFRFHNLKNFLDENIFLKRIKQLILLIYMLVFYYFFINKIIFKKKYYNEFLLIFSVYLFCNIVSHLSNGYEHERFMYQFHVLHVIFMSYFISFFYDKKN